MLEELATSDFRIYTQKLRAAKDEYTARKVQKDRQKFRILLSGLLDDRELIIHYKDGDQERQVIGTRKKSSPEEIWPPLPNIPYTKEIINRQEVDEIHHIAFWLFPLREPMVLHLDSITKVIIRAEGLNHEFFNRININYS